MHSPDYWSHSAYNMFGLDSSSEDERQRPTAPPPAKTTLDPSVYLYDEVYDEIERQREQQRPVVASRGYIDQMKERAEQRNMERELVKESIGLKELAREGVDVAEAKRYITEGYKEVLLKQELGYKEDQDDEEQLRTAREPDADTNADRHEGVDTKGVELAKREAMSKSPSHSEDAKHRHSEDAITAKPHEMTKEEKLKLAREKFMARKRLKTEQSKE